MKKIENKKINKLIILSAIIIITTFIIGIAFIYIPFLNKNKSLRNEILHERERNVLIGKIRGLDKHLNIYTKRMAEGKSVSWLLSKVSDMATKENIEISSIKPGDSEDVGLYTKLYVILDTVSTYHQLGSFVSKIESFEKFLRVEDIDVKRLDLEEDLEEREEKFKAFDVKAHIVISTVVLKE